MLNSKKLSTIFWADVIYIACHIINRVYNRPSTRMTPYKIWKGRKPNLKYFYIFESKCYILKDKNQLEKFDEKSNEGPFMGYSTTSHTYQVFNLRIRKIIETINVIINDSPDQIADVEPQSMLRESEKQDIQSNVSGDDEA